jgi:hypothetical protein
MKRKYYLSRMLMQDVGREINVNDVRSLFHKGNEVHRGYNLINILVDQLIIYFKVILLFQMYFKELVILL